MEKRKEFGMNPDPDIYQNYNKMKPIKLNKTDYINHLVKKGISMDEAEKIALELQNKGIWGKSK